MASAWYDLNSRMQSNHVVLQRKDMPKSWLNKQRQLVNGESWVNPSTFVVVVFILTASSYTEKVGTPGQLDNRQPTPC